MKHFFALSALAFAFSGTVSHAKQMYEFSITNTSSMPISGGVAYITTGQDGTSDVGKMPSAGFVTLCQTGNSTMKFNELKANPKVAFVMQTSGPVLPGETMTFDIPEPTTTKHSFHFEAMYGKSKEACASISIPAASFNTAIMNDELIGRDEVVVAGANTQPELPAMTSANAAHICDNAAGAVDCLRLLSTAKSPSQIGYFPGYLPSVFNYLENRYGAADVLTLMIPPAGAVHYHLQPK